MTTKSFYQFYKYDVEIHVGTLVVTTALRKGEYGLCDVLTIIRQENTAANATFTFIPPEGVFDLEDYQGQDVTILIRTPADGWQQVFTGFVDVPSIDFLARKITLVCTDDRNNQIIQMNPGVVDQIGLFDATIFGQPSDQADELSKRLQTVTANFDFDRFGNPQLTDWQPKITPDFIFNSDSVQQGTNPTVSYTSRKTTVNTINITFNYSYQRLHQQSVNFVWAGYDDFIASWWTQGKPSFPQRTSIATAINNGDWRLINPTGAANFVPLWPAGGYQGIIWQPNDVVNTYVGKTKLTGYVKDSSGNFVTVGNPPLTVPIYEPVLDANGKQIQEVVSTTITDTSSILCRGAQWTSALKFSQTVSEVYRLKISAPQSVDKFGVIDQYATYSQTDNYDTTIWEKSSDRINTAQNFYIDRDINRAALTNALQVAYYKAKHDILEVHRDIQVTFTARGLRPQVDLIHTVQLNVWDPRSTTAHITATGKVSAIAHNINFRTETATTNITLSMTRAQGSATDDPVVFISTTQNPGYIGIPQTINLGTYLGRDPDPTVTIGAEKWVGYIGNKELTAGNPLTRTTFPESFVVDYPDIPDSLRNTVEYFADTTLNISIPNDPLETST